MSADASCVLANARLREDGPLANPMLCRFGSVCRVQPGKVQACKIHMGRLLQMRHRERLVSEITSFHTNPTNHYLCLTQEALNNA